MDDFRRRYDVPRRDYGLPPEQAGVPSRPQPSQPPSSPYPQPAAPPPRSTESIYAPPPAEHQAPYQADHHRPVPHPKSERRFGSKKLWIIIGLALVVVVVLAVFLSRPAKPKVILPADLAKQASFSLYYPSPLPAGYVYDGNVSTFLNGQAYYEISKGTKHIVVREQASSAKSLDLSSLSKPVQVKTALGQAAVGVNTGETAALVLAGATLITINSSGQISQADVASFINNLQNLNKP